MLRPSRHLAWMHLATAIMIVLHPVRNIAHPSFPSRSIIQSVAQEMMHFTSPRDVEADREIGLIFNMISKGIFVISLAGFSLAALRLCFWDLSPCLICGLRGHFSKSKGDKADEAVTLLHRSSKTFE